MTFPMMHISSLSLCRAHISLLQTLHFSHLSSVLVTVACCRLIGMSIYPVRYCLRPNGVADQVNQVR
jgi:hypothetical protein